ncbi:immunity 49 family protein [Haloprofundus salilacus]|uniref:immunity 49 family protein n=1 Tax=Haloprofundus salilacus TaxID=2876190 RepID=UPI001CC92BC8|nr:immunity 49 family protein [Haloprofundus salilacus]
MTRDICELRSRYDEKRSELSQSLSFVDEVPEKKLVPLYNSIGIQSQGAAAYAVFFDEFETARSLFADAAEYSSKSITVRRKWRDELEGEDWRSEPVAIHRALISAVLSGNKQICTETSDLAQSMDKSYVDDFPDNTAQFYRVQSVGEIIAENTSKVSLQLISRQSEKDTNSRSKAIASLYQGFSEEDESEIQDGIQQLVSLFEERVNPKSSNPSDLFEQSATAFFLLAHERGFEVTVETDSLPEDYVWWILE